MEFWDIYDEHRVKTGRVMARDDWHMAMQAGDFHISVTVLVRSHDGRYLITQRTSDKAWAAGWWEFPGGGVQAGRVPKRQHVANLQKRRVLMRNLSPVSWFFLISVQHPETTITTLWMSIGLR